MRSGATIAVKLEVVDEDYVRYIKSDNPDGPRYTTRKIDVAAIKYQNGTRADFYLVEKGGSREPAFAADHNQLNQKANKRLVAGTVLMSVGTTALAGGITFMAIGFSPRPQPANPTNQPRDDGSAMSGVLGIMLTGLGLATDAVGAICLAKGKKYQRLAKQAKATVGFNPVIVNPYLDRYNSVMIQNRIGTVSITF